MGEYRGACTLWVNELPVQITKILSEQYGQFLLRCLYALGRKEGCDAGSQRL